jgi:hypothetical protein
MFKFFAALTAAVQCAPLPAQDGLALRGPTVSTAAASTIGVTGPATAYLHKKKQKQLNDKMNEALGKESDSEYAPLPRELKAKPTNNNKKGRTVNGKRYCQS